MRGFRSDICLKSYPRIETLKIILACNFNESPFMFMLCITHHSVTVSLMPVLLQRLAEGRVYRTRIEICFRLVEIVQPAAGERDCERRSQRLQPPQRCVVLVGGFDAAALKLTKKNNVQISCEITYAGSIQRSRSSVLDLRPP